MNINIGKRHEKKATGVEKFHCRGYKKTTDEGEEATGK